MATAADTRSAADMRGTTAICDGGAGADGSNIPSGSGCEKYDCGLASAGGTGMVNPPRKNNSGTDGGADGVGFEGVHVTDPGPTRVEAVKEEVFCR